MMYAGEIGLPKESAREAFHSLTGSDVFNTTSGTYHAIDGVLRCEMLEDSSILELYIRLSKEDISDMMIVKMRAKKFQGGSPEDSEPWSEEGYSLMGKIYDTMRERHNETITPLGIVGIGNAIASLDIGLDEDGELGLVQAYHTLN